MPDSLHGTVGQRLQCLLGIVAFIALSWGIGFLRRVKFRDEPCKPFPWRVVLWGVALQFVFALIVLRAPAVLEAINDAINALLGFTKQGARVVFGNLVDFAVPTTVKTADGKTATGFAETGAIFAFFVLPTIVFFSALTAIAYHTGIMQLLVQGLAWVMAKSMRTSGAETLSAAANIFVGQTEAPLLIKPFLDAATRSELMCVMVAGFANIASGVLGVYTEWIQPFVPNAGGHMAAACFISAPASLLVSKLIVPETGVPTTAGQVRFKIDRIDANVIDAATRGTTEGLGLAMNVGAMLIAFTALVALVNAGIGWASVKFHLTPGGQPLSFERILSYPMAPLAWLCGVPWSESREVGSLLGIKTVLTELMAYKTMQGNFIANPNYLSPRTALLATYALCGFANFASVGIQVGGISVMAPARRAELSRLGLLAMVGGAITSLLTAATVGVLL